MVECRQGHPQHEETQAKRRPAVDLAAPVGWMDEDGAETAKVAPSEREIPQLQPNEKGPQSVAKTRGLKYAIAEHLSLIHI